MGKKGREGKGKKKTGGRRKWRGGVASWLLGDGRPWD